MKPRRFSSRPGQSQNIVWDNIFYTSTSSWDEKRLVLGKLV